MKKLDKVITIRVDKETHKAIKRLAEKENRSVNNFLFTIIKKYIGNQKDGKVQ